MEMANVSNAPTTPMTFGQQLVGLTFNPSGDEKVNRAKILCAELYVVAERPYADGVHIWGLEVPQLVYKVVEGPISNPTQVTNPAYV